MSGLTELFGSSFRNAGFEDGQLVVMFGNNPAEVRMAGAALMHDLTVEREEHNLRVIHIDPRRNATVANQEGEWIPIRPGTDAALIAGIAHVLITEGLTDEEFLHKYCVGYDAETMPEGAPANSSYKDYILGTGYDKVAKTPAWASKITQIPESRIISLAHEMAESKRVFITQGWGLQRRSNGEQTARAVMMLPSLLGQLGLPGTSNGQEVLTNGFWLPTLPSPDNPCQVSLPAFLWTKAIEDPTGITPEEHDLAGADKLEHGIKFIFNYASNLMTCQHSDVNHTHSLLEDESKVEFIVTSDLFLTDSALYSDIVIPDLSTQETINVTNQGVYENDFRVQFNRPIYGPKFERRDTYDVCGDIAKRMGVYDEFSDGGKTREDWVRELYESAQAMYPTLPSWDAGFEMGIYREPTPQVIAFADFVKDPEANPLITASGKIEIYSTALAALQERRSRFEECEILPIPGYEPAFDGFEDCTEEYPLLLTGFHPPSSVNTALQKVEVTQKAYRHVLWINPLDAEPRGIEDGKQVLVRNEQGKTLIDAKVTERIIPGAVAMPAGAIFDGSRGDGIDQGGCFNTLTTQRPTSIARANPQYSNICQVERFEV
jgi:Tat-targeted selenate reductase subunit YnfE